MTTPTAVSTAPATTRQTTKRVPRALKLAYTAFAAPLFLPTHLVLCRVMPRAGETRVLAIA